MSRRIGVLAAAVLLLSSCGGGTPAPGSIRSNSGRYRVSYRTAPEPVPLNQPFTIKFQVEPGAAAGRTVEVDARMPAHGHGMNRAARVSRLPDGTYLAEGLLFHMPGHWELYVDISESGRTDRAQLDVDLK